MSIAQAARHCGVLSACCPSWRTGKGSISSTPLRVLDELGLTMLVACALASEHAAGDAAKIRARVAGSSAAEHQFASKRHGTTGASFADRRDLSAIYPLTDPTFGCPPRNVGMLGEQLGEHQSSGGFPNAV